MSLHLHIEPIGGIAGDMLLAALIDLSGNTGLISQLPDRLGLTGVTVQLGQTEKHKITARTVSVTADGPSRHRHLPDIRRIIESSDIPEPAAANALAAFRRLAEAEARIHNSDPERIHFHEVGGDDAIVDITGACCYVHELQIKTATCGPFPLRRGVTKAAHGPIPLPAPATMDLLEGWPVAWEDGEGELVTPTGAALATTLCKAGAPSAGTFMRSGYGAGDMDWADRPNLVRAGLYESNPCPSGLMGDTVCELTAAIDDSTGEQLGRAAEILLGAGALDAYYKALVMKKGRPGWELTVIGHPGDSERLAGLVLMHTSTGGVRTREMSRRVATRKTVEVTTAFGKVSVKVFSGAGDTIYPAPEYEECKALAEKANVPLARVQQEAIRMYWNLKGDR